MTLSYIIFVQAAALSAAGIDSRVAMVPVVFVGWVKRSSDRIGRAIVLASIES